MKLQKVARTYTLPYIIRAEWTTYLVFSIMFIPLSLFAAWATYINSSAWPGLLIFTVMFSALLIWAYKFKIILEFDKIIYKSLLSKNSVKYTEIQDIKINIGLGPDSARKSAYYRLNIHNQKKDETVTINMKPFSQRDLAIIVDAIASKKPSVKMDNRTTKLRNGNFKPIVSEGIRQIWQVFLSLFFGFLVWILIRAFL